MFCSGFISSVSRILCKESKMHPLQDLYMLCAIRQDPPALSLSFMIVNLQAPREHTSAMLM